MVGVGVKTLSYKKSKTLLFLDEFFICVLINMLYVKPFLVSADVVLFRFKSLFIKSFAILVLSTREEELTVW